MIALDDVSFSFGDTVILDDLCLQVDSGELVGLIGPNGAGKTTTLRLISGILNPDAGTITVDGDAIDQLGSAAASRRVAVVPQASTLSFDFTCREVIEMGRNPYKSRFDRIRANDREIVDAAMATTRTNAFADRAFSTISGGERKRVLIARAIAQATPNLLLDEPTANLDINHQVAVFELARSLVEDDKAVIAAIHDLGLAARFCDRLALLADGSIIAEGDPRSVLDPERLERAYGIKTAVVNDPITGAPSVVPLSAGATDPSVD